MYSQNSSFRYDISNISLLSFLLSFHVNFFDQKSICIYKLFIQVLLIGILNLR